MFRVLTSANNVSHPSRLIDASPHFHASTTYRIRIKTSKPPTDPYSAINLAFQTNSDDVSLHEVSAPFTQNHTHAYIHTPINPYDIKHILISPQRGEWQLDEVELYTSLTDSILFKNTFNDKTSTLVLPPYKSLDHMKEVYDEEYRQLKEHIILTAAQTTSIGTLITIAFTTREQAIAYAIGGSLGILYAIMLQRSIDGNIQSPLFSAISRQLIIATIAAAILSQNEHLVATDSSIFLFGVLGFITTRIGYL